MQDRPYIDVEFEVIEDPRPTPTVRWTFWEDDIPNLFGIVCAVIVAGAIRLFFP